MQGDPNDICTFAVRFCYDQNSSELTKLQVLEHDAAGEVQL